MDESDSGIEFGKLEQAAPDVEVRPDRNRLFAVVPCGNVDKSDLPIFVDIDVMRDMEAHARSNTHVELGGVMLGGQYVDSQGEPFVVVREALRAEHYEATRGSFKFTHETWEQITRDREQFPKDLQLVGWYHTHPDWGVFLSGMDMFICEHFFNRQLDVALVIDPCRGDRGWFFWEDANGAQQKKQVSSFYLMANRYRDQELLRFANLFSQSGPTFYDPRYDTSEGELAVQPVVHLHDQRSPLQSIATMGMLTIQFLVLSLIAYRILVPVSGVDEAAEKKQADAVVQTEKSDRIYREILDELIDPDANAGNLVDHFESVHKNNQVLAASVEGQAALLQQVKNEKSKLTDQRSSLTRKLKNANDDLKSKNDKIAKLQTDLIAQKKLNDDEGKTPSFWSYSISWPIALALALLTAIAGVGAGFLVYRVRMEEEFETDRNQLAEIPEEFGDQPKNPDEDSRLE